MMRDNHYEHAFETYLRGLGASFVPVDETHRSCIDSTQVKSPDFIIVGPEAKLVVDVKGRQFPVGRTRRPSKSWQNWVKEADVDGLCRWSANFGGGFRGVLAFVYHILPSVQLAAGTTDTFVFRDKLYLARGVDIIDYHTHMVPRSPSWETVHMPMADFRRVVRPFSEFLSGAIDKTSLDPATSAA